MDKQSGVGVERKLFQAEAGLAGQRHDNEGNARPGYTGMVRTGGPEMIARRSDQPEAYHKGYKRLGFAVLAQAVDDVKTLQRNGVIVNGTVVDNPSAGTGYHRLIRYKGNAVRTARRLIAFWRNDAQTLLDALDSDISAARVMEVLGL
jgi:hypothetical protein